MILLKHVVNIITSCWIITAALSQVESKSGRRNSPKYLLIGLISFTTYIALPGIINSANFVFAFYIEQLTKRQLKLFRLADNDKCIYCSNADSIEHTFIDCRESARLYSQIISWFNHCQGTATLSNEKVALHVIHHVTDMLSGPVRRRLDLLIILVKQHLYSSKHLQKELSLDELVKK